MIDFTPKPENIFNQFIELYYSECKKSFPKIEAIAGKWDFEDLIPGLSDFDTRFVCSDDMTDEDWCKMSTAVGEVHLDLCNRYPEWVRIFEHLPGVNLTWTELTSDASYYPEYRQWSFYSCKSLEVVSNAENSLSKRGWDLRDEYFFLKKFFTFYGPYNRSIDRAINLGPFKSKYPLHSRLMHYFTPPVQAAVSIIQKKPIKGKFESLRIARDLLPETKIFDEIFDIVGMHYEVPILYAEPEITLLEERLFDALKLILERVKEYISIIPSEMCKDEATIKKALKDVYVPPQLKVYDSSRFCRLFKGRMYFYMNAPDYFENIWLIQNELARVGDMFYKTPFSIYWQAVYGKKINNPDRIVSRLAPEVITGKEAAAALKFSRLVPGTWKDGTELEICRNIVEIFDDFFMGLNKIKRKLEEQLI